MTTYIITYTDGTRRQFDSMESLVDAATNRDEFNSVEIDPNADGFEAEENGVRRMLTESESDMLSSGGRRRSLPDDDSPEATGLLHQCGWPSHEG